MAIPQADFEQRLTAFNADCLSRAMRVETAKAQGMIIVGKLVRDAEALENEYYHDGPNPAIGEIDRLLDILHERAKAAGLPGFLLFNGVHVISKMDLMKDGSHPLFNLTGTPYKRRRALQDDHQLRVKVLKREINYSDAAILAQAKRGKESTLKRLIETRKVSLEEPVRRSDNA